MALLQGETLGQVELSKLDNQRQQHKLLIENFLEINDVGQPLESQSLSISDTKTIFLQIIKAKKKLEGFLSGEEWVVNQEALKEIQSFIEENISKLNSAVGSVKKKLVKRSKKRLQQKKKKTEYKKQCVASGKLKNKLIDEYLASKRKEVDYAKVEESMKRQADIVLHEVRRKKNEAKKMLTMLVALLKLREVRSQQEVANGGFCSAELTETFTTVLGHLKEQWARQLEVYNLEERGLKVMLEETAPQVSHPSKLLTQLCHWEEAMFGVSDVEKEHYRALTHAESDIYTLLSVRYDWDRFLAGPSAILSSSIPPGWVLPPQTPSDEWKAFLEDNTAE